MMKEGHDYRRATITLCNIPTGVVERKQNMSSYSSELSRSQEYLSFRSSIPLRKIVVDADGAKGWKVYDSNPKTIKCPLICLPPVCGTADIFFRQILSLAAKGYRVISAEAPVYWSIKEWCDGFRKLLDYLELDKVHLFGASLGGFLAQKFTEINAHCPRVVSLVLCNTFTDTSVFSYNDSAAVFWILPSLVLKKMVMGNFATEKVDEEIIEAIDFMVERLESLTQPELASRLTMNCINCYVQPQKICHLPVTIIDVFDEYALSNAVREEMYKCYPNAKLAHLKSGGNFPYLSRSAEVNLHLQIHLRQFEDTEYTALEKIKI
ncbi:PREDICTED: maspardin-like isoform X2 [Wasmannia auropunctata]|uniref:maspardin-like isoform X2 n=1 Tax=Wasmannia auropunctata TaxID=64793 RepID=UPI0005F050DB|nr:PREDICTED: maspardin-like isoform X2 [Wasmannia auropunctata]